MHKNFLNRTDWTLLSIIGGAIMVLIILFGVWGCTSPMSSKASTPTTTATTTTLDGKSVYIKNSVWKTLSLDDLSNGLSQASKSLARSLARSTTMENYIAAVDAYNANTLDDYLRIYYDGVPDVADAPTVDVYEVNPSDYSQFKSSLGISRQDLIDQHDFWVADAEHYGALLFIDHIPPQPIENPPASMYAFYAIYAVNAPGGIEYEDHCGYNSDESFNGQWITVPESQGGGGWASIDAYYYTTRNAFNSEVQKHSGWTLIEHQLYIPPVTP